MNEVRPVSNDTIPPTLVAGGTVVLLFLFTLAAAVVGALIAPPQNVPTPTPDLPDILIVTPANQIGGTFKIAGDDWPAEAILIVYLGDPNRPDVQVPIYSSQTDAQGKFTFDVPFTSSDPGLLNLPEVDVIVATQDDGIRIKQRMIVILVTPTPTPPTPTVTPTFTATPVATTPGPTATPTPTPSATPIVPTVPVITDWRGEYFNNPSLTGNPILVRNDARVQFNWGNGAPDASLPVDGFSARWTRQVDFPGGNWRFSITMDDGARVFVDNTPLIDEWRVGSPRTVTRDLQLSAGGHTLRVEMFEQSGQASVDFSYEQVIVFTGWKGEYFPSQDLGGSPAFVRDDALINFDWGSGSPGPTLPPDRFSARWSRTVNFPGGVTRFLVRADDGARLTIDGTRVLDEWHDASPTTYEEDVNLSPGAHVVVLEYYEAIGGASIALVYHPASITAWEGEYFNNVDLAGLPVLVRDDAVLDFNWGNGAPDPIVPPDRFSARWTRRLNFEAGTYFMSVIVDDGARLFIDGAKVIDEWHLSSTRTYSVLIPLTAGEHEIRVEYFENTGQARAAISWARTANTPTPVTATATPSPTASGTPTPSGTPASTPTPSPTPTATPTLTATTGSPR